MADFLYVLFGIFSFLLLVAVPIGLLVLIIGSQWLAILAGAAFAITGLLYIVDALVT